MKRNSIDDDRRRLERLAALGDQAAQAKLRRLGARIGDPKAIADEWVDRIKAMPWSDCHHDCGDDKLVAAQARDDEARRLGAFLREHNANVLIIEKELDSDPIKISSYKNRRRVWVRYGFISTHRDRHSVPMHPPQLPYFHMLAAHGPRRHEGGSADLELAVRAFRRLGPLARWHLADSDGTPTHYAANAEYFWSEAMSGRPVTYYTPDTAISHFETTARLGALVGDSMPESDVATWLQERLPKLQDLFLGDMYIAGFVELPQDYMTPCPECGVLFDNRDDGPVTCPECGADLSYP